MEHKSRGKLVQYETSKSITAFIQIALSISSLIRKRLVLPACILMHTVLLKVRSCYVGTARTLPIKHRHFARCFSL